MVQDIAAPDFAPTKDTRPRRAINSVLLWRLTFLIFILVSWQAVSGTLMSSTFISQPTSIAARLYELFATGEILPHLRSTLAEITVGYTIGAILGLTLGGILGRTRFLSEVFEPFILAAYSVPKIALAPVFLIWLGLGFRTATAVVILSVFFLVFYGTFSGMRNMDDEYVNQAKIMGAGTWLIARRIIAPAALPFIIIGLKTAVPYGVIGAIVGEFMGSSSGLGYFILLSGGNFDTAGLFSGVIVLVIISTLFVQIVRTFERLALKWRDVQGTGSAI